MTKSIVEMFPKIDDYAEFIIKKELGEIKAPVDIEKIITSYGIQIFRDSMDEKEAGAIVINENNSGIIINEKDHLNRQRFTLAHEFGHFISYRLQNKTGEIIEFRNGTSSLGTNMEEIFANRFAASILMPRQLLIQLLDIVGDDYLKQLPPLFEVSKQALEIRMKNLLS